MPNRESPNFSQLVCSAQPVQSAFALYRPLRFWWKLILWLHGKPSNASLPQEERTQRVADGFRFYAGLYRFLAVIFAFLTPLFALFFESRSASYCAAVCFLAGIYLWCASGLGYAGAKSYSTNQNRDQAASALVVFMVMIIAFLSMFVAIASVAVHSFAWLAVVPNLVAVSALFVFGVGSYLIEIIYLATARQVE